MFEVWPAICSETGTDPPAGALPGTCTFTWYKPTKPGAIPAKVTVAGTPPIVTVGALSVGDNVVSEAAEPAAGAFWTAPSPVQ